MTPGPMPLPENAALAWVFMDASRDAEILTNEASVNNNSLTRAYGSCSPIAAPGPHSGRRLSALTCAGSCGQSLQPVPRGQVSPFSAHGAGADQHQVQIEREGAPQGQTHHHGDDVPGCARCRARDPGAAIPASGTDVIGAGPDEEAAKQHRGG